MVEIINKLFKYALINGVNCSLHTFDNNGDKIIAIRFEKKSKSIANIYTYTEWTQFREEQCIWIVQNMLDELEKGR